MKYLATILFLCVCSFGSKAQITELLWANQIGSTSTDQINGISNDIDGNILTAGIFSATVDFDPGPGEVLLTSDYSSDFFIQKNDSEGNLLWVTQLVGNAYGSLGLNLDLDGNIFVMGYFTDSLDVNPAADETHYIYQSEESFTSFILKLNPEGEFIWVKQFTANEHANPFASVEDVQCDVEGNVFGLLIFQGSLNIGSDDEPEEISADKNDIVFFKLNEVDGTVNWFKQIGGIGREYASLILDEESNIFLAGHFQQTVDFDPGIDVANLETTLGGFSSSEGFVAKYNSEGEFTWVKQIAGECDMAVYDLKLNSEGLYIAGIYTGTVDFDLSPDVLEFESAEHTNGFVLSLDFEGDLNWAKEIITDNGHNYVYVETDELNNLYITGSFVNNADLDPSGATFIVEGLGPIYPGPSNTRDAYIAKWNSNGEIMWGGHFGSTNIAGYIGLHVFNSDEIYGIANFKDTLDINPNLAETESLYSEGGDDVVVFKLKIEDAVGIVKVAQIEKFNLYPNPATDIVTIKVSGALTKYIVSIYNVLGEEVMTQLNLQPGMTEIRVNDLPDGIYHVILFDQANGMRYSESLIISSKF